MELKPEEGIFTIAYVNNLADRINELGAELERVESKRESIEKLLAKDMAENQRLIQENIKLREGLSKTEFKIKWEEG